MKNLSIRKINELSNGKKKGFTLVELIIVIAIIAILAAMAIPKFSAVRLDARVSNDVAAAKNIATQAATLVADGTIDPGAAGVTIDVTAAADASAIAIRNRLDGRASTGDTEALSGGHFEVDVATDEDITVRATDGTIDDVLYPDNDGTLRTTYLGHVD